MACEILGIDYYLPERLVTNNELARENPDWDVPAFYSKIGIAERHWAAREETASDLAFEACQKLLARQLVAPEKIDYLMYCTQCPDYYLPSAACVLQDRLGLAQDTAALDFNLGCSGYVYGIGLAKALIVSGQARHVLLATADTYSKLVHPRDRTVCMLFGDAGTATLIGPTSEGPGEIWDPVLRTDGSGFGKLIVPAGGLRLPRSAETAREETDESGCTRSRNNLFMDGAGIFAFAITAVPRLIRDTLAKVGLAVDDVDWFVYHQANKFMLEELFTRSKIPPDKAVMSFEKVGNTVSSSIPIAIKNYQDAGNIQPGHRLMLVGFGVGLSWGAGMLTWGRRA